MAKKRHRPRNKQHPARNDLAEALERYINPEDEQFDLDFTIEMMRLRPDWFSDEERERVAVWAKARMGKR